MCPSAQDALNWNDRKTRFFDQYSSNGREVTAAVWQSVSRKSQWLISFLAPECTHLRRTFKQMGWQGERAANFKCYDSCLCAREPGIKSIDQSAGLPSSVIAPGGLGSARVPSPIFQAGRRFSGAPERRFMDSWCGSLEQPHTHSQPNNMHGVCVSF